MDDGEGKGECEGHGPLGGPEASDGSVGGDEGRGIGCSPADHGPRGTNEEAARDLMVVEEKITINC